MKAKTKKPLNALRFAFSLVTNGGNHRKIEKILLWNDILPPSKTQYNSALDKIAVEVEKEVNESINKWRKSMKENSACSFDGSWIHRRNSYQCVADLVDSRTQKIIAFKLVEKTSIANTEIAANGLEIAALKEIIKEIKDDKRISYFIHDNDTKAVSLISNLNWNVNTILDPNHAGLAFGRRFDTYNLLNRSILNGLKGHLTKFLKCLMHADMTNEEKKKAWANVSNHFLGNHECCPFSHRKPPKIWKEGQKSSENVKILEKFLFDTMFFLENTDRSMNTNLNECFHSLKANYCNKQYSWRKSWKTRIHCAILDINEGFQWRFRVYDRLKLPKLSNDTKNRLIKEYTCELHEKLRKRSVEYRAKESTRRKIKRDELKKQPLIISYNNKKLIQTEIEKLIRKTEFNSIPFTQEIANKRCQKVANKLNTCITSEKTTTIEKIGSLLGELLFYGGFESFTSVYVEKMKTRLIQGTEKLVLEEIIYEELANSPFPREYLDKINQILIQFKFSNRYFDNFPGIKPFGIHFNAIECKWVNTSLLNTNKNMNLEKIIEFQDYLRFQGEFSLFCKEKYQCITSFNHMLSSVQLTKDDKNIICNLVIGGVILLIQRFYSENRISKALEISPKELSKIIKKLRNKTCAILDKEELKINPSSFL